MTAPQDPNDPQQPQQPQPGQFPPPPGYQPPPPGYQPPPPGYQPPPPGYQPPPPGYQPPPPQGYSQGYMPPPPPGSYNVNPIPLPPGVELASRGRRTGAFFLALPLEIVTLVVGYLIWGGILWGKGTSPALKVLKCRVVDEVSGQPVGFGKMALRDLVLALITAICGIISIVSWIMFLSGEKRQSLGDKMARTIVVYDPNNVLQPPV